MKLLEITLGAAAMVLLLFVVACSRDGPSGSGALSTQLNEMLSSASVEAVLLFGYAADDEQAGDAEQLPLSRYWFDTTSRRKLKGEPLLDEIVTILQAENFNARKHVSFAFSPEIALIYDSHGASRELIIGSGGNAAAFHHENEKPLSFYMTDHALTRVQSLFAPAPFRNHKGSDK